MTISFTPDKPEWADVVQLVRRHWEEVGINVFPESMEHTLFYTRKEANEHDAVIWDSGGLKPLLNRFHVPVGLECNYGIAWAQWYQTAGDEGREPPPGVKDQIALFEQVLQSTDTEEHDRLTREILQLAEQQFYSIGVARAAEGFGIVSTSLGNAPTKTFFDGDFPYPAANNLCQIFRKQS